MVRAVTANDAVALGELFELSESRCYCQYWQFEGDHRSWQVQCAQNTSDNRRRLERDLAAGQLTGMVSEDEGRIVGWIRIERPQGMSKLYQGRLYRGLPCFEGARFGGAAIACVLVAPAFRRKGIARRLISGAVAYCRHRGDAFIEAFPRGATDVSDEEQWMGPLSIYRSLGFDVVHDFAPYPVLRLDLDERLGP